MTWQRARIVVPVVDIFSGRKEDQDANVWVRRLRFELLETPLQLALYELWRPDGEERHAILGEAIELLDEYTDDPGAA